MFLFLKLNTKDCAPKFPAYVDAQKNRFTRTYCVFFSRFYWCCCSTKPFIHSDGFSRPRSVKNSQKPWPNKICKEFPSGQWPMPRKRKMTKKNKAGGTSSVQSQSQQSGSSARLGAQLSSQSLVLTGKTHRLWGSHILRQAKHINVYKYYISCDVTWCIHFFVYSGSFI